MIAQDADNRKKSMSVKRLQMGLDGGNDVAEPHLEFLELATTCDTYLRNEVK